MTLTLLAGCGDSGTPAGSGSAAPAGGDLIFTTGGETGTYYAFGGVIAQDVSANTATNVTAISSDGSKANVLLLQSGDAQLGFCQSDVMAYAYNGTSTFADTGAYTGFSTVANLYMEQVQIVTCNPDIKTVADLAGQEGLHRRRRLRRVLQRRGHPQRLRPGRPQRQGRVHPDHRQLPVLRRQRRQPCTDGTIDAAFVVAGAPTNAITSLATTKDVYLVSLDDEHIDTLLAASPYYSKTTIPADTYDGTPEATTVAVGAVVIARDDVSEDDVYNFVSDHL